MTLHHNLIAGEWVGSNGVENINPSNTNEVVGLYATASADDAKTAIAAAKAAFPAWSRSGILERHAILKKTADEILARKDELGKLLAPRRGQDPAGSDRRDHPFGADFRFLCRRSLEIGG